LKKGCLITLGVLILLIAGLLFGANWFLKEAFGPKYKKIEIELNNERTLICDETYNAAFAAVFYDVNFLLVENNKDTLKFGRATFSNENWQKNIKFIEFENWLILQIDQGTYSKILMNNRDLKIHKDKEFSPLELRDDKMWESKYKDIPAWVYTGKSIIDSIVENKLYVEYEYRIGLYEPFEFYNQTVEYEINVENGEFMTKKIFERKRIRK
jgi:hypothetical protein